jgi:hypothetical protein
MHFLLNSADTIVMHREPGSTNKCKNRNNSKHLRKDNSKLLTLGKAEPIDLVQGNY